MPGWPWMEGKAVASVADAAPDEDDDNGDNKDPRPLVKDLIQEHRELLDELQAQLEQDELYDRTKHDDLWCLRFLLSHKKNGERALAAAKTTLQFRQQHGLDDKDIRATPPQHYHKVIDEYPALGRFMTSGVGENSVVYEVMPIGSVSSIICNNTPKDRHRRDGVVTFINIGTIDPHQLAELETADWVAALAYASEWNYQWLDYLTRTSGRLTKSVRIVDVGTVQLSQIDLKCQELYTAAIGGMQDCFPQAVQSIFICFAPGWIQMPWRVIRPFLPVRVVEKMDFLDPTGNEDDMERLLRHVPKERLPVRFGGSLVEWPPESTSEE